MMNILRAEHSAEYPYVMMSKITANNHGLSLAARGLLAWLLDKPDTWDIDPDAIARLNKTTLYEIKKLLGELTKEGYLIPPQRKHINGRWRYTPYRLRETPNIAVDVEIQIPENSDTKTDALLQDDCNSSTVSDSPVRAEDKHESAAEQITKINNNSNHSEQETTKTDSIPVDNSELPDAAPAVMSVSENPEPTPIILDIRAMILPDVLLLPATILPAQSATPDDEPPASHFVLEEIPVKHEPPAQLQPVECNDSSAPPPVPPPPSPERKHNDFYLEAVHHAEQNKPDFEWKRVQEAFESVTGCTVGGTLTSLLNTGIALRGVDAVLELIDRARNAHTNRVGMVVKALKNWRNEPVPTKHKPQQRDIDLWFSQNAGG